MKTVAVAVIATLSGSAAVQAEPGGDPRVIIAAVDRIDRAVDAKAWDLAEKAFTAEVAVDFESLSGQAPSRMSASDLVGMWAANLSGEKTSFHQRTNHVIAWEGPGAALVTSQAYAWNKLPSGEAAENGGNPLWEVWGTYVHRVILTDEGWRVSEMGLDVAHQRGSDYVRDTPGEPLETP